MGSPQPGVPVGAVTLVPKEFPCKNTSKLVGKPNAPSKSPPRLISTVILVAVAAVAAGIAMVATPGVPSVAPEKLPLRSLT